MEKISILHPLWLSFYSKKIYRYVAEKWKGKTFLYLFMLVTLVNIPFFTVLKLEFSDGIKKYGAEVIKQAPLIKIERGRVVTPENKPYYISMDKDLIMVIDTSGKYKTINESNSFILLTANKVFYKKSAYEVRTYDLSEVDSLTVTNSDLTNWMNLVEKWIVVIIVIFWIIFAYIWRLICALLFSLFGLIIQNVLKVELSYSSLFKMTIIAMTPPLVLNGLLLAFGVSDKFPFLLFMIVTLVFLYFGLTSFKDNPDEQV